MKQCSWECVVHRCCLFSTVCAPLPHLTATWRPCLAACFTLSWCRAYMEGGAGISQLPLPSHHVWLMTAFGTWTVHVRSTSYICVCTARHSPPTLCASVRHTVKTHIAKQSMSNSSAVSAKGVGHASLDGPGGAGNGGVRWRYATLSRVSQRCGWTTVAQGTTTLCR